MCEPLLPPRPAPVYSASYKPPTESIAKRAIVIDATEGEIRDWIAAIDDLRDMRVRLKRLLRQMKAARLISRTIGDATLYLGDCREVLPTLADASADMIFTDPPYGHNNNDGDLIERREAALGRPAAKPPKPRPIANDGPQEAADLAAFLFAEAARVLRKDSCCCCCCCGGGPDPQFARWSLLMDRSLAFDQTVIWDKGPMGMGWKYRRSYETVLVGHRKGGKLRWLDESHRVENVIRPGDYGIRKIIPRETDHPTPKPTALAAHFISLHTAPGDLVLDPFMGAGSTAEAAIRAGRRFIGIESDPRWYAMACRRAETALKENLISVKAAA